MIAYIKGKILAKSSNYIIVLAENSLGYKINTGSFPNGDLSEQVEFYCYEHIREDSDELYGFKKHDELELFENLISVSGVGPKVAQSIIINLGREKVISAIMKNDLNLFKSVSGVGTKVAAKIIVELKNKLTKDEIDLDQFENDETVDALIALGLKKSEILPALKNIPEDLTDTQARIKHVLKNVASK
jgi:Holliday junction DNA helicase RuvA